MAKSLDGESIFLSDADLPPLPPRAGADDVAPTVVLDSAPHAGGIGGVGIDLKAAPAPEGNETMLYSEKNERCVGWLLAVSGPMEGKSFPLAEGRNSVGRNPGNKVVLATDDGISRNSQVFVVYDPEENVYMVTPGDGSAIARLNGKRLDMAAGLKHGDMITLSKKTVLRFIPACDDMFRWNTEEQEA